MPRDRPESVLTIEGDELFCVDVADSPETVREHATKGGFPVTAIHRVASVIDPTSGEAAA